MKGKISGTSTEILYFYHDRMHWKNSSNNKAAMDTALFTHSTYIIY